MIIKKYNVTLKRLVQEDIELVRVKRNATYIKKNMFFQDDITAEMQKKWFESISNIHNYYFIIEYNNQKIGLINGKNIDYSHKTAEGGLFIWEKKYWGSSVAAFASICLIDFTFLILKFERIFYQVKSKNSHIINFNTHLGYTFHSEDKSADKKIYVLTRDRYFSKAEKLRTAAMRLCRDFTPLAWEDIYFKHITKRDRLDLYSGLPEYLQPEIDKKLSETKIKELAQK